MVINFIFNEIMECLLRLAESIIWTITHNNRQTGLLNSGTHDNDSSIKPLVASTFSSWTWVAMNTVQNLAFIFSSEKTYNRYIGT